MLVIAEGGDYVAAAYIVFLTLIVVYIAIIATKLPHGEGARDAERAGRTSGRRERRAARTRHLAQDRAASRCASGSRCPRGARRASSRELTRARRDPRGRGHLHLQPHRALPGRRATRSRPRTLALAELSRQAGIRPTELLGRLYALRGEDAVRHLFAVAAGLDSMIVGEAEVQGQVKRAYELALVEGATGPISNRLFRDALAAGKRVRTETALGRSRVSVSSVAVDLARDVLGDLETRRVLVIGAGENGELTAKALAERGVATVFVANRRYDRAIGLAQRFGGKAVRFDDLPAEIVDADIVVGCTVVAAPDRRARRARGRDGAARGPAAAPDGHRRAARHRPARARAARHHALRHGRPPARGRAQPRRARGGGLARPLDRRRGGGALRALARDASTSCRRSPRCASAATRSCEQVLRENESRWESLSDADRERLELMARAIVSRLLHEPTVRLKRPAEGEGAYVHLQALRELFGLEPARSPRRRRGHVARRAPRGAGQAVGLRRSGSPRAAARSRWPRRGWSRTLLDGGEVELVEVNDVRRPRRRGGDKSRWVKEIEEALLDGRRGHGGALGQGRARRAARRGWRSSACPSARRARRLCGAARSRALPEGAVVGHEQPAPPLAAPGRATGPGRARTCAGTWTPGCASCRAASTTRSCSRARASTGSGADEGEPVDAGDAHAGARPGLPGARGARRRRGDCASWRRRSPTGGAGRADRRARGGDGARRDLPHAGRCAR